MALIVDRRNFFHSQELMACLNRTSSQPFILTGTELELRIVVGSGYIFFVFFGGLVVRMLASGTQVRGFKPGQSRQIFQAKNP
jgi:hypothetical protein